MTALADGGYGGLARSELFGPEGMLNWNGRSCGYRAFVQHGSATGVTVPYGGNLHAAANDLLRHLSLKEIVSEEPVRPPLREVVGRRWPVARPCLSSGFLKCSFLRGRFWCLSTPGSG